MSLMYQRGRTACIVYALLSVALCWSAQALTVHYNYQGDWTALFQTGPRRPTPPALESENIYKFEKTRGYDGQFYHYVAHDPLLTKGFSKHVDDPRLRWRRILVPGLAFLAAGGQQRFVDTAYLGVTLCFVFLGAYWLARYCCLHRRHPAWGLGFLVVPAVAISVERLTIDVALAALCVGFAVYAVRPSWRLGGILVLAPLARETGIGLVLAVGLAGLMKRRWRLTAVAFVSALPWLVWVAGFVHPRTRPDPFFWLSLYPFQGIFERTLRFPGQVVPDHVGAWAGVFDYVAVLGMWLALAQAVMLLRSSKLDPVKLAMAMYALLVIFVGSQRVWSEAYAFGRVFSPFLIFLGLQAIRTRSRSLLLPLGLVTLRVAAQLAAQLPGIVGGLTTCR